MRRPHRPRPGGGGPLLLRRLPRGDHRLRPHPRRSPGGGGLLPRGPGPRPRRLPARRPVPLRRRRQDLSRARARPRGGQRRHRRPGAPVALEQPLVPGAAEGGVPGRAHDHRGPRRLPAPDRGGGRRRPPVPARGAGLGAAVPVAGDGPRPGPAGVRRGRDHGAAQPRRPRLHLEADRLRGLRGQLPLPRRRAGRRGRRLHRVPQGAGSLGAGLPGAAFPQRDHRPGGLPVPLRHLGGPARPPRPEHPQPGRAVALRPRPRGHRLRPHLPGQPQRPAGGGVQLRHHRHLRQLPGRGRAGSRRRRPGHRPGHRLRGGRRRARVPPLVRRTRSGSRSSSCPRGSAPGASSRAASSG